MSDIVVKKRLQKILADAGFASRRKCEELILDGRVAVDGDIVKELGVKVDPERQKVECDGVPIKPEKKVYLALYKPRGYVCTARKIQGQNSVMGLVEGFSQRLFTVGRLDKDSEGLILLTNDGSFSQRVAHPRNDVKKTYLATVSGPVSKKQEKDLKKPEWTSEGKMGLKEAKVLRSGKKRSEIEVAITTGKNREIRRILAAKGFKVRRLIRTRIGELELGSLRPGRYRRLTKKEIMSLLEE